VIREEGGEEAEEEGEEVGGGGADEREEFVEGEVGDVNHDAWGAGRTIGRYLP
jgi:hypothetical protein